MFSPIATQVVEWGWDEVPEVEPETIVEVEAMESYSLYGFKYLLTNGRVSGFCEWWQSKGRHMTRPLELNITN